MKNLIIKILAKYNLKIVKKSDYENLIKLFKTRLDFELFKKIKNPENQLLYLNNIHLSKSQLRQDLFVLNELNFTQNGFFVEFGAKDGVSLSNTYLLEKEFNWNGILGEPAKIFHKDLPIHRSAYFEKNCLWSKSNHKLIFNEVSADRFNGLSTISQFSNADYHSTSRKLGKEYEVITISLEDMLDKFKAPKLIDYLSIDTEGSEYEILKNFNFKKYKFKVITVEHNFTNQRNKINKLLCENGYKRKFEYISDFDDWYVLLE